MSDDLTTTTAGPTTTSEPTTRVKELREGQNEGSVNTAEGDGSDAERSSKITTNAGPGTSTAGTTLTAVDREKASLSTTTPSTTLNTKEGEADESSPDKSTAEVPEKAKTATPPAPKSEKTKSRENGAKNDKPSSKQKPSFWSNFFRTMFCLGSPDTHDLDLPMVESKPREKTKEPSTASTTEAAGKHVPPAIDTKTASMPVPLDLPLAVPSTPSRDRSATADPAVIVPPTPPSQTLPPSETGGVTSGSVQYPGSTGDESLLAHREQLTHSHSGTVDGEDDEHDEADESFTDDEAAEGDTTQETTQGLTSPNPHGRNMYPVMTSDEEEEERLILQGGAGIPIGPDGEPRPLLPPVFAQHNGRKCLVLDLDETLVHSSFKLIPQADYVVPVEIEHQFHNVYVIKRPGVDAFLQKMGELYEIVVFTASLSKYADPVLDKLDQTRVVTHRLFRESCYQHRGNYIKDLSQLGRPLASTIILDNSPASYIFHPNNAVPVSSWFNDPHDTELVDLCPFLGDLRVVDDVRGVLDGAL